MHKLGFSAFNTSGYVYDELDDAVFEEIKKEVEEVRKNENAEKANNILVGQLSKEYHLKKCIPLLESLLLPNIMLHDSYTKHISKAKNVFPLADENNYELFLGDCWVNFQEKNEWQPMHDHRGVYSFIIFVDIPYDYHKELNSGPGKKSNNKMSGQVTLHHADVYNGFSTIKLETDKQKNGTVIVFPADTIHSVNPFFSVDATRITISGNFYLRLVSRR